MTDRWALRAADKVTIIGPNGSGKSFLALGYVAHMPSVIVHDPKHEIELPDFVIISRAEDMLRHPRVIWRSPQLADPVDAGNWAGYAALQRKHTCLYLDEAALVTTANRIGPWLRAAIITGRSQGVGVWAATQRPKDVSNLFFSEAHAILVSPLLVGFDVEKVKGFVPEDYLSLRNKEFPPFSFYAVRRGEKHGRLIRAGS
ncbi:hypothetical protein TPY_3202 [Sulfobacillus acidophilus TPY]|uniref:AAA+ ATPase domain-containing protein n=1 Tax=Sulfobacillus acidophilus (strain ATCC 700253 / DSM 10332 / NAL) TaxID=679936 RepID=G8TZG7_SULAD|nr:hypothetical protein TPY_3202 [Sulfobacillus acidophilus TPY]AEW05207.1 hypothetical protein Sulac_1711 [Sulfobacillus acidophilus DSM 10332]